jgi:hypothetical protein
MRIVTFAKLFRRIELKKSAKTDFFVHRQIIRLYGMRFCLHPSTILFLYS